MRFFNFLKQKQKKSTEVNNPSISSIRVSKQVVQKKNCLLAGYYPTTKVLDQLLELHSGPGIRDLELVTRNT